MRNPAGFIVVASLWVVMLASGCAHGPAASPGLGGPVKAPKTVKRVTLDPTRIRAGEDPLTGLDGYDADDLFQLGYDAFQRQDLSLSVLLYERLLEEFPEDENSRPARYNLGLAFEKDGALEDAVGAFQSYVDVSVEEGPQAAAETRVRIALLLQRLGRIEESRAPLDLALAETLLVLPERWEAQILYTIVTAQEGRFDRAEWNIKSIGRAIRRRSIRDGERFPFQSAMLWYHVGAVFRMRAASYKLDEVDDLSALEKQLEMKARDLLEARQHYKRCLKHLVADWSGPAALALGGVYEDFRRDMLAAPKPSQHDAEHGGVYQELLEAATGKFLERAASDYREILANAQRFQLETAWVFTLEDALARCEELLAQLGADQPPAASKEAPPETVQAP